MPFVTYWLDNLSIIAPCIGYWFIVYAKTYKEW